ncbi:MAG: ACP S-malonyltransferase [Chloroflexi bacterium]|nr:ACP S-malonyltransferase [Chloroflexota bacterium]
MGTARTLALLFPGQASQQVGMGVELAALSPRAEAVLRTAEQVTSLPLRQLCASGPLEELTRTTVAQPAVVATSVMAWLALEERLPERALDRLVGCCAGHSVGEYAALVAAGALEAEHALDLVHHRARLMAEACAAVDGTMAAVLGLEASALVPLCTQASAETGQSVEVANLNAPDQVVLSGARPAVEAACRLARAAGARRALALNVAGPFHSRSMRPAGEAFAALVAAADLRVPRFPIVLNQTARPTTDVAEIRRELVEQTWSPVRWADSLQAMAAQGSTRFVELGPGKALAGLARRTVAGAAVFNVQDAASLRETLGALTQGVPAEPRP